MKWIAPAQYRADYRAGLQTWHRWFAWRPAFIRAHIFDGIQVPAHFVWLEYVDRKFDGAWWNMPFLIRWIITPTVFIIPTLVWQYRPYFAERTTQIKNVLLAG